MVVWLALIPTALNQTYLHNHSNPVESRHGARLSEPRGTGSPSADCLPNDRLWEYGGRPGPPPAHQPDTPVGSASTSPTNDTAGTPSRRTLAMSASPSNPMPSQLLPHSTPTASPP